MKLPICIFDAKNAVLCPQCEGKIETGELTKADVDASIILANVAKSNNEIENFTLILMQGVWQANLSYRWQKMTL